MEMGRPGGRGQIFPAPEPRSQTLLADDLPAAMARKDRPELPEITEFEAQRHYLHLSQMTLGMMGVSLFGTCTMKYNSKTSEYATLRPELAEVHPYQHPDTLQGVLGIMHDFDDILRSLSGMDQFIFQAGGGADAAYTMATLARAYWRDKGKLGQRTEMVTSVQAHPCNPATAAAAGFKVVNLPLEENGYPSLEALKAAVSEKTALIMINNPDDMGIYNPEIKEWVRLAKEAGALCFYDHANFNGVMGKLSARELGFDACMFMLHKTFGAPKAGGGPAVGAFGCSDELAPYLPTPVVVKEGERYRLDVIARNRRQGARVLGQCPPGRQSLCLGARHGGRGHQLASDISVVANNYMDKRLARLPGLEISNPDIKAHAWK
jgi:glycine dehydrogenase subunit 2